MLYGLRSSDSENQTRMIDLYSSRQRAFRMVKDRRGFISFEHMQSFRCNCITPCLSEASPRSLAEMYEQFASFPGKANPYEQENEYLIEILYDTFVNTDRTYCDRALAEILGVDRRRAR